MYFNVFFHAGSEKSMHMLAYTVVPDCNETSVHHKMTRAIKIILYYLLLVVNHSCIEKSSDPLYMHPHLP